MSMRGRLVAAGIAAAILSLSAGGAGAVVVVGTGNPALDVPAVQAAVDQGGTVILSGTFDFGTHSGNHIIVPGRVGPAQDVRGQSTVFIYQNDVTVTGETDESGNLLTTIRNGMPPFWIGWDGNVSREVPPGIPNVDYGTESLPQDAEGRVDYRDTGEDEGYLGDQTRYAVAFPEVSATIRQIYFDSPLHYGIKASAGRNIAFLDNVIRHVRWGGLVHLNNFADATQIAGGTGAGARFYAPFTTRSITGSVIVEGNRLENVGTEIINTHRGECFGLAHAFTDAALTITGNEVRNVGRDEGGMGPTVLAAAPILVLDYFGGALVEGNTIHNSADSGVWALTVLASSPVAMIADNTIEACTIGIDASDDGHCEIQGNVVSDCGTGFNLATDTGSAIRNIVWSCGSGIVLGGGGPFTAENNTVDGCTGTGVSGAGTLTSFARNIVASNRYGVRLPAGTDPSLVRCNDVWHNTDGNWLGISDPSGMNGNFSADPLYCFPPLHNYTLAAASPCLPGNHPQGADCDTIGALALGCTEPLESEGISDEEAANRAEPVVLRGPWPNPSGDVLQFGISLSHPSRVQVKLFSVAGKVVATLVDRELPEGHHIVARSAVDLGERGLPGGVYYLQLEASGQVETRKIVLAR